MQKLPPLSAVRAFEAAARHRSFTRAAQELGMTQAAVSYQIRLLEERIGTALFVRLPRHVELTQAGRELAPAVTEAFEQLRTAFESVGTHIDHHLRLSVLPTIAAHWLVPRLGRFQSAHPQLAVDVDATNDVVDFSRDEVDICIRSGLGVWPELEAHFLMPSHFTPVASPALLRSYPLERPADLLELPLLGPNDPWWPLWFAAAGLPGVDFSGRPGTSLGTQQFEAMAAIAGQGVALVNPFLFADDLAAGRLVQLFEVVVQAERSYWLVYPKARRRSAKVRAFRDWALAEAARDAAERARSAGEAAGRTQAEAAPQPARNSRRGAI